MNRDNAPWIERAAGLPVAFAQVREDPALDLTVLRQTPSRRPGMTGCRVMAGRRGMMIASGGCTAAFLVGSGELESLHLVDASPAQVALTRLKLELLARDAPLDERLRLCGHGEPRTEAELRQLATSCGVDLAAIGDPPRLAEVGLDFAGRYEAVFAAFRERWLAHRPTVRTLLAMTDPASQRAWLAEHVEVVEAWRRAFAETFAQDALVAIFGPEATRNPRRPFAEHFHAQLLDVIGRLPAATNSYLSMMLLGGFRDSRRASVHPWFAQHAQSPAPVWTTTVLPMLEALRTTDSENVDWLHLSNILDWLDPKSASDVLAEAARVLAPGGRVIIRQLNSSLELDQLTQALAFDDDLGKQLAATDRSFFYPRIWVGGRP